LARAFSSNSADWIAQSIADNSLVAVTVGSYIKERYPLSYAPRPLCWNALRVGADWLEHLQRHQWRLMHIVGNSWG